MTHDLIPASAIVAEARAWLGVPFRHQGRAWHGVDCIGLASEVVRSLGCLPPDYEYSVYTRTPQRDAMQTELLRLGAVPGSVEPGALVVCQWFSDPQHVAIVADGPHGLTLIHALADVGKVVEHRFDAAWQRLARRGGIYALPGVHYGR